MVTTLRVGFVEWPEGLLPGDGRWGSVSASIVSASLDLLITNEMPFGPWIAEGATFSKNTAELSLRAHEQGLEGLTGLNVPAIVSSRPIWKGARLANEAFVLENGSVRPLHRKQYFPNEPGWFESEWYAGDTSGFEVAEVLGIKLGVLICTEVMFNEHARAYGRQGANLIAIPRASGVNLESWKIAGAMASLVAGAYVASSNRVGRAQGGTSFGGGGFAYAPHGKLLSTTTTDNPLQVFDLDLKMVAAAQSDYPCYVPELS